jgi:HD-GYP domain-containing protein (c-di-GMP phosphodiesterase class II)
MSHLSVAELPSGAIDPVDLIQYVERTGRSISDVLLDLEPMQEATDLRDLYACLARAVVTALNADACLGSTLDVDRETLRDVSASVVPPAYFVDIAGEHQLGRYPLTRQVIETGTSAMISMSDPDGDPAEIEWLHELGFAQVIVCALRFEGEAIGIIEVYRVNERPFREEDPRQIEILAKFAMNLRSNIAWASKMELHYTETMETLVSALEARNPATNAHAKRIPDLALAIASSMQLPADFRRMLRLGSILHDVGKIGVPDAILLKPSSLSDEEWEIMRRHPEIGEQMLRPIEFLAPVLPIVRHHHERWDGKGYPDGFAEKQIPLGARIVTVCDSFDAMVSDRPYRDGMAIGDAVEEVLRCAGTQFDPMCAEALAGFVSTVGDEDVEVQLIRYAN